MPWITKAGELADLLNGHRDHLVVLAEDAEGNRYSPMAAAEVSRYVPESTWAGKVWPGEEETAEEQAVPQEAIPVICLWPVR